MLFLNEQHGLTLFPESLVPLFRRKFQIDRFFFTNDSVSCSQTGRTHEPDGGVEAPASVHEFQNNLRGLLPHPNRVKLDDIKKRESMVEGSPAKDC
jgi:phosphoribosylformylglycinamidine (FGAM) synthase-like amidotransferase family enzyme